MADDPSKIDQRVEKLEKRADEMEAKADRLDADIRKVSAAVEPLKKLSHQTYNRILKIFNAVRQALMAEDEDP